MADYEVRGKITTETDSQGIEKTETALGKFGNTLNKISEIALGVGLERLGETIVNLGSRFLKDSTVEANNFTRAMTTLDIIAGRFNVSGSEAQKTAQQLGTELRIGIGPAAESLQNLLKSGLSLDKASDLLKRFTNEAITGKSANITLSQAVQNLSFAYATNNSAIGNLSGISENFINITEKGKESLIKKGMSVKEITEDMAKYEGMINLTNLTMGSSERFTGTLIDKQAQLDQKVLELKVSIGTALMPTLTKLVDTILNSGILDGLKNMASHFGDIGTKVKELSDFYIKHKETINIISEAITIFLAPSLALLTIKTTEAAVAMGVEFVGAMYKSISAIAAYLLQSPLLLAAKLSDIAQTTALVALYALDYLAKVRVTVATAAYTAGQWLLNAALNANPIGLVIVAVAALAAGLIYAYNHSETFRKIVNDLWEMMKGLWSFLTDKFLGAINAIANAFHAVSDAASRAFGSMNKTMSSGGNTPKFASGVTNFSGGLAIVGENGPELVHLPQGSDVIPNNRISGYQQESSPGFTINQTNNIFSDLDMEQKLRDLAFNIAAA